MNEEWRLCVLCGCEVNINDPSITILVDGHRKTVRTEDGHIHVLATKFQTERRRQQQSPAFGGKE